MRAGRGDRMGGTDSVSRNKMQSVQKTRLQRRHHEPLSAAREEDTCSFVTSQDAAGYRALATN